MACLVHDDHLMVTRDGIIVTSLLSLTLGLAGCGVGGTDGSDPIKDSEGAVGLLCEAELTLTGTFNPPDGVGGMIPPTDPGEPPADWECIPVGTWTITAQANGSSNCQNVALESQYVYTITEDANEDWIPTYQGETDSTNTSLSLHNEGPCLGTFEHYAQDGKQVIIIRPVIDTEPPDGSLNITGTGVFELYDSDQRGVE